MADEIKVRMEAKWSEIEAVKAERNGLFQDEEGNRDKIAALYFEKKILELQYMHLKREQLAKLKATSLRPQSIEPVEQINETCIAMLQKSLIADGFGNRVREVLA